MKKKLLSAFLTVVMLMSILPAGACTIAGAEPLPETASGEEAPSPYAQEPLPETASGEETPLSYAPEPLPEEPAKQESTPARLTAPTLGASIAASGKCGDDLTWTLKYSSYYTLVISGDGDMWDFSQGTAPWYSYRSQIDEVQWDSSGFLCYIDSIGDYAFYGCDKLTRLYLPTEINTIGNYAFSDCTGLTYVHSGASIIGDYAFFNCTGLKDLYIDGAWEIGDYAFAECVNVSGGNIDNWSVTIGEGAFYNCRSMTSSFLEYWNPISIGGGAFQRCTGLTNIVIPDGITKIGDYAFANCAGLTGVSIGKGVSVIEEAAFYGCTQLACVQLPESVITVVKDAFALCYNLSTVFYTGSATQWGRIRVGSNNEFLAYAGNISYDYDDSSKVLALGGCGIFTGWIMDKNYRVTIVGCGDIHSSWNNTDYAPVSIVIENGVTGIGNNAFYQCTRLKSVTIPDSVAFIGDSAFYGCSVLGGVTIPDSVTRLGSYAFYGCSSLTDITIPDSVTQLGYYAFSACSGLQSITLGSGVKSIGESAFHGCSSLKSITLPRSVTTIDRWAFQSCTALTEINVEEGSSSFCSDGGVLFNKDKTTLIQYPIGNPRTAYTIPDTVTTIDERAFIWCTGLTAVTIPGSVTRINNQAFYSCPGLTELTIPDSVVTIGFEAFYYCSGLQSITLGSGVTTIQRGTVSLGNNSISGCPFYGCDALTCITAASGNPSFSSDGGVLFNKDKTTLIQYPVKGTGGAYVIPEGVNSIGNCAFCGCTGLTAVTIPGSVTAIGEFAFLDCSRLACITMVGGLTEIGTRAFYQCTGLRSIAIPGGVTTIKSRAFENCKNLRVITLPDTLKAIYSDAFLSCNQLRSAYYPGSKAQWERKTMGYFSESGNYYFSFALRYDYPADAPGIGDVNGSGGMDITDMACLFTYLATDCMECALSDAAFTAAADINGDKAVNILDYQTLYEWLRE